MADDAATVAAVVEAVQEDRLWQRHMEIAAIGATGRGGVNRQALTPEDGQARRLVLEWASRRGFTASVDGIGNLFIRRAGAQPAADPMVAGSHLDTQPTGGNFDGIFGVLAALEVLDAASDAGVATRRPMEMVVWTNEEGARFQPATMGSAVFAGALQLETVLASPGPATVSRWNRRWPKRSRPPRLPNGVTFAPLWPPMWKPTSNRGRSWNRPEIRSAS